MINASRGIEGINWSGILDQKWSGDWKSRYAGVGCICSTDFGNVKIVKACGGYNIGTLDTVEGTDRKRDRGVGGIDGSDAIYITEAEYAERIR